MRERRAALFLFLLGLAGCTSVCDRERLPEQGHARTPEILARLVAYEATNECWSSLYDVLSAKTRDTYSRFEWRLGVKGIKVPPPYDYRVVDVMERGHFDGFVGDPRDSREGFAYFNYDEPGKKPLRVKLLLRREPVEDSKEGEWRVALLDQQARLEKGDFTYNWFDE